jgi:hypothetical protein
VKPAFSILMIFLAVIDAYGQNDSIRQKNDTLPNRPYVLQQVERDGITMPEVEIKEVTVFARPKGSGNRELRKYERLVYNIKKVYPYALMVRVKLLRINNELQKISGERDRKKYVKDVEKEIFAEYEDDIRDMTISQGKLLIKLIDRETKNTSYDLIREYRGKFSAAFWQGIARIFGTNLKDEYDAAGDDALIEEIINEIDAGRL